MLTRRYVRAALLIAALALVALGVNQTVLPVSAQTAGSAPCGTGSAVPCELTGHKLVANPNDPAVYVLQVETKEGPRSFVATRPVMERFARELLEAIEGRGGKPL